MTIGDRVRKMIESPETQDAQDSTVQTLSANDLIKIKADVASTIIIPSVVHLLTLAMRQPEEGQKEAAALAAVCRAEGVGTGFKTEWDKLAAIIEACFVSGQDRDYFMQCANAPGASFATQYIGRLCGAHFGIAEAALTDHLAIMPQLMKGLSLREDMYRRFLLPYVEQFWADRLSRQPFRFSNLTLVREGYAAASALPEAQRLPAILAAILVGVRVTGIDPDLQRWLDGKH